MKQSQLIAGSVQTNGSFVLAGTIVAEGGRTGNINYETPNTNPSHVHLNVYRTNEHEDAYTPPLRRTMDKYFPEKIELPMSKVEKKLEKIIEEFNQ